MSSNKLFCFASLVPFVAVVLLLLSLTKATTAKSFRGPSDEVQQPPRRQKELHGHRQVSELQEYAAQSGHIDPHIANGHVADNGGMVAPMYNSLGPSHVAAMGGSFDALANPEGYGGVGPGSLTMGIVVKNKVVERVPGGDQDGNRGK
ncbi:hypothetical protein VYU27_004479 [Nannochloropsis oceanica]